MDLTRQTAVHANFGVGSFYRKTESSSCNDNRMHNRLVRVAETSRHIEQNPLPCDYHPGILGPPATWKTFFRQAEAIKFAQLQGQGLMVFSFEGDAVGDGGKRSYVVTHPSLMWLRHIGRKPNQRCTYEVIQEMAVCKLYFDLEFLYLYNPKRDGVAMTNTLIQIVCYFLHKEFSVLCSRTNILDLTSTSGVKFSRHLIFNIPNVAFATNIHVGNFVVMVCNKIREWDSERENIEVPGVTLLDVNNLFVLDDKNNKVLFCDEGVYTKNRNFRLYLSSKRRKNAPLIVAQENEYVPICNSKISPEEHRPPPCIGGTGRGICMYVGKISPEEQLFQDSLITLVTNRCQILTYGENSTRVNRSKGLENERDCNFELEGYNQSPYPEIDSYIRSLVVPGYIRCWYYFSQGELLVYEIAHNRFCHNIGREHKSNGVMYVVNLKTATFYQKCHDPDCKDFRSDVQLLPESTVFWKHMDESDMIEWIQSTEDWNNEVDDDLLLSAVTQAEVNDVTDAQLGAADAFEMWDMIDDISSTASSIRGSQPSSQLSLSQGSNPWDKLSLISSPGSSLLGELSQPSAQEMDLSQGHSCGCTQPDQHQRIGTGNYGAHEIECDELFLRAVVAVEERLFNEDCEMEFMT